MQTKTITLPEYKHLFYILFTISAFSLILYVIAINQTVRNVVARQKMQVELSQLTSRIAEMEFSYITAKNSIDLSKAYTLGFKDVAINTYVQRNMSVAFAGNVGSAR